MRWHVGIAAVVTGAVAIGVSVANRRPSRRVGQGPDPECVLPPRGCNGEHCADLVQMPVVGPGYIDGRLDDEQTPETSTSYLRRDLIILVRYAAAKVACKSAGWNTGTGGPVVLSDMSERDGSTPGTLRGAPRHPRNTHRDGLDIDIAYFQRGLVTISCDRSVGIAARQVSTSIAASRHQRVSMRGERRCSSARFSKSRGFA